MAEQVLLSTKGLLPFEPYRQGKVRDIYEVGNKRLLIVAADRLSAFDSVLPNGIPYKGKVLNTLSEFWFRRTCLICENHMLTTDVSIYPKELRPYAELLKGRSMLVKRAKRIDIECVARAYLAGSAWRSYRETGSVCGIKLPSGLKESSKLPEVIFTPATKAESGHDINISFMVTAEIIKKAMDSGVIEYKGSPGELARSMRAKSLDMLEAAAAFAYEKGLILADSKLEFGVRDGKLLAIDEAFTPDSSRFWSLDDYEPGKSQVSFDKQPVRDYLEDTGWNKKPPAPELPPAVVEKTTERYLEALKRITGQELV